MRYLLFYRLLLPAAVATLMFCTAQAQPLKIPNDTAYTTREPTPDGTGKVYMGREIARPVSREAADWLERPTREREERTDILIKDLELKPTDAVADVGAGTGYIAFRLAAKVPKGLVVASDILPEMVQDIKAQIAKRGIENMKTVTATEKTPGMPPNFVDVVVMVDAYHEFAYPREMLRAIRESVRPGGRVVFVEYRAEDPNVLIKPLHKMTERQVIKEASSVGLVYVKTRLTLPQQHMIFFERPR
jgi:precorrin-6B methylase 2